MRNKILLRGDKSGPIFIRTNGLNGRTPTRTELVDDEKQMEMAKHPPLPPRGPGSTAHHPSSPSISAPAKIVSAAHTHTLAGAGVNVNVCSSELSDMAINVLTPLPWHLHHATYTYGYWVLGTVYHCICINR